MNLLIDAGNTRIKWALAEPEADGNNFLRSGVLPVEQAGELPQYFAGIADIQHVWVSNVAGEEVARHIRNIRVARYGQHHFVIAREVQSGVRNSYASVSQLGSDRWAALIAAWHLTGRSCLVVNSGTATTVDTLSAQGEFVGGLILPGVELMQRSLRGATAQLKAGQGEYAVFPRNTADALFSGAIQATCGAIQRQHALLDDGSAPVVLSGGAAEVLQAHLNLPLGIVDNLVLQGLLLISQESGE